MIKCCPNSTCRHDKCEAYNDKAKEGVAGESGFAVYCPKCGLTGAFFKYSSKKGMESAKQLSIFSWNNLYRPWETEHLKPV